MNTRIKKLRRELDMTQEKFGAEIGVKGNTVAQWESGRNDPPDSAIVSICREFHVDEHWLRTGDGKMFTAIARDKEIMRFVGEGMRGEEDNFRRRFLLALARLPEELWKDVEDFAQQITAENKEEEQD